MIGRDKQLQEIRTYIDATIAGGSKQNVLFVTGEAGIGKSTLLREVHSLCQEIQGDPMIAMADCSTPLAGQDIGEVESLGPWREIMGKLVVNDTQEKTGAKKLVGEIAMAWIGCVPLVGEVLKSVIDTAMIVKGHTKTNAADTDSPLYAASQQQVFQQYINFLAKLSDRVPLVLMIDDFHWADTSSTNLLFAAARDLQEKRALFIIAYRPDDAASSRGGEGHPLLHIRNELERYSLATEIGVPKMSAGDMDQLLRSRYTGYHNNDEFERWLAKISGGNALFITHFLDTLEEDGLLDRESGNVHNGFREVDLPGSAQAVVQERIRRMDKETRELLRYASVEGDTFTARVLSLVMEIPQLKLLQKLRVIEEVHNVVRNLGKQQVYSGQTTAYQFSHALLHRALYESLGEEERELLHGAMLDALKEEWENAKSDELNVPGMAARLAVHAEVLKEYLFAAAVLLKGAQVSWQNYAEGETLRQIEGTLTTLDEEQNQKIVTSREGKVARNVMLLRGDAMLLRGEVHSHRGRNDQALSDYQSAQTIFEALEDTTKLVIAMNRECVLRLRRNDVAEAETIAYKALEIAERGDDWKGAGRALFELGLVRHYLRDFPMARKHCERALEIYEAHHDEQGMLEVLPMIAEVHDNASNTLALEYTERCRAIARKIGDRSAEARMLANIGSIHLAMGDLVEALDCLRLSLEIYLAIGSRDGEATVLTEIGRAYYYLGDCSEALSYLADSAGLNHLSGNRLHEALALRCIGAIQIELGDCSVAFEQLHRCLAIDREIGNAVGEGETLLYIGDAHRKLGDYDAALDYLEQSLTIAETASSQGTRLQVLVKLGDLYLDRNDPSLALDCFQMACSLALSNRYKLGELTALIGIGRCYCSLNRWTESGEVLQSALTTARVAGMDHFVAQSLMYLGLLDEVDAASLQGEARAGRLRQGVAKIEEGLSLLGQGNADDLAKWGGALERLKQQLSLAMSGA